MRGLIYAGVAAAALSACSVGNAEDGGPATARNFPVGAFSKLEVAGPFDVDVTTGGQPGVRVNGPSKLVEKMVVEVQADTLVIRPEKRTGWFSRGFRWSGGKAQVAVSVPMLTRASIAGSGDIDINRIAGQSFSGEIAGSGNMRVADLRVESLRFGIAGSGKLAAVGQARQAHYEIAGSGDIQADRVASEELKVEIAGSGNVAANARSTASVEIAGAGDVRVTGGAKCSVSKAGSGNVRCS